MKGRATALVVMLVALGAAGVAYSHGTPTGLPKHDAVFGGGKFDYPFAPGGVRNFGLTARRGGAHAEGTLQYGRFTVEITCLRVQGNAAVVGGIVRADPTGVPTSVVPAAMYFVDKGPPSGQDVGGDTASALQLFGPGEDPGDLPRRCPAADPSRATQLVYAGDVVVNDER